jgi:hypothetical protein
VVKYYLPHLCSDPRDRFTKEEIFERDNWMCGICEGPVRKDLTDRNHPEHPTVDHIRPQAQGGEHTRANVRLAHRFCNNSQQREFAESVLPWQTEQWRAEFLARQLPTWATEPRPRGERRAELAARVHDYESVEEVARRKNERAANAFRRQVCRQVCGERYGAGFGPFRGQEHERLLMEWRRVSDDEATDDPIEGTQAP